MQMKTDLDLVNLAPKRCAALRGFRSAGLSVCLWRTQIGCDCVLGGRGVAGPRKAAALDRDAVFPYRPANTERGGTMSAAMDRRRKQHQRAGHWAARASTEEEKM